MTRLKFLFYLLLLNTNALLAQQKFTISGNLRDIASGEDLIGAPILVQEMPGTGIASNEYGFYSLTLPAGVQLPEKRNDSSTKTRKIQLSGD
jgi:hypothetical protein